MNRASADHNPSPSLQRATDGPLAILRRRIDDVRRRDFSLRAVLRFAQWTVALGLLLLLLITLDRALELSQTARSINLVITVLLSAGWFYLTVLTRWLRPPPDDAIALRIERDQPGLRQRLISSLQLTRSPSPGSSPEFIEKLIAETALVLGPSDLSTVTPATPVIRWSGAAIATAVVLLLLAMLSPAFLLRALAVPGVSLPHRTGVERLTPSPLIVARGEPVTLSARVTGEIPPSGEARFLYDSHSRTTFALSPTTQPTSRDNAAFDSRLFSTTLPPVTDSFTYTLHLGDNHAVTGRVEVTDRPAIASITLGITPPPYSRRPTTRRSPADLTVLQGSTLDLSLHATKPLHPDTGARLSFHFPPTAPSTAPSSRPPATTVRLPTTGTNTAAGHNIAIPPEAIGFTITLVDTTGIRSAQEVLYRLRVLPDAPPQLTLRLPTRREDLVTAAATIALAFDASDDLGLAGIKLKYLLRPAKGKPPTPGELPLDIPPDAPVIRAQSSLGLARLNLSEGATIEWWLEATDNRQPIPNTAASDHYTYTVGSDDTVRAALMSRLDDSLNALREAQAAQQTLTHDLGQLLLEKPPATTPPK